jgi:hypothetical protein
MLTVSRSWSLPLIEVSEVTSLTTSAEEVLSLFNVTRRARAEFETWRNSDRRKDTVVPHVMEHRTDVLYDIRPEDIERFCHLGEDEHALGNIKKAEGELVEEIVDWEPDYAFVHTFHYILEKFGRVPTWQEFRRQCYFDLKARSMLWNPAQELRNELAEDGWSRAQTYASMRWRVGNYYYSFLRELHVIAVLREQGIDVRFHPLADALFRVDAWWQRTAISLYIGNAKYKKTGTVGRKPPVEEILGGASPPFTFETIELSPAEKFGIVRLVSRSDIYKVGEKLLRARR